MKKNIRKTAVRVLCMGLASLLALSAPEAAYASGSSTQKDETVYVNLDASGKVRETTVSDWLHADGAEQQIADQSDLENIENVKSNEKPVKTGNSLTWVLNPGQSGDGRDIYYEGTTKKAPPLSVSVSYTLNGKEVTAGEIAGKTGKVTIKVGVRNNDSHTVTVNGKQVTMATPMTAVAAVVLPSDTFKNVSVSSGSLLSDGNNQFAAFLTMPGLSESLGLKDCGIPGLSGLDFPEDLIITADAANFTLGSIAVAATPELIDAKDLEKSVDIGEIKANLEKLRGMQDDIQKADPQKDIRSLFTDPDRTAAARLLVDDVFDFYGLDTKAVDVLPEYVTNDNIRLYDRVTSDLDKADLPYLFDDKTLRGLNDRVTDRNAAQLGKLLSDYDELKTFDMTKLNHVLKLTESLEKNYDKLDDVFGDAEGILNRFNKSDIHTLSVLDSSKVQDKLDDVLDDLQSLGQYSGLIKSGLTKQDYEDIIAVVLKNHSSDLAGMVNQSLPAADGNGYIRVSSLLGDGSRTFPASLTAAITAAIMDPNQLAEYSAVAVTNLEALFQAGMSSALSAPPFSSDPNLAKALAADLDAALNARADDGNITIATLLTLQQKIGTIETQLASASDEATRQALFAELCAIFNNFENLTAAMTADGISASGQQTVIQGVLSALGTAMSGLGSDDLQPYVLVKKSAMETLLDSQLAALPPSDLEGIIKPELETAVESVQDLSGAAAGLQSALSDEDALGSNYLSDLSDLKGNLRSQAKNLRELEDDVGEISDDDEGEMEEDFRRARELLTDKDEMDYLISWADKLKGMKSDMDDSEDNVALLRDLLKEYDDPKIRNIRSMLPTLRNDADEARPILESIRDKLSLPDVNASLHRLPQTTAVLLKTEKDVRANRKIMDIFIQTTRPETVALFKSTFGTLDDFRQKGSIDDYLSELDDADELLARKDEYVKLSDQYRIFSGATDGADTSLKFVFKTDEIKKPEEKAAAVKTAVAQKKTESGGFLGWVRSVWNSAADSIRKLF